MSSLEESPGKEEKEVRESKGERRDEEEKQKKKESKRHEFFRGKSREERKFRENK